MASPDDVYLRLLRTFAVAQKSLVKGHRTPTLVHRGDSGDNFQGWYEFGKVTIGSVSTLMLYLTGFERDDPECMVFRSQVEKAIRYCR